MPTKVSAIGVAKLSSSSKYVDKFIVQIFSDNYITQVGTATSGAVWDGALWQQKDYIEFSGLTFGNTYFLRAATVAPISGLFSSWTNFNLVAGSGTAPACTYGGTFTGTASGINYQVTPISIPSDIKHWDVYWSFGGTVPASTTPGLLKGLTQDSAGHVNFFVGGAPKQTATVWIRGVNTSMQVQAWTLLNISTVLPSVAEELHDSLVLEGTSPGGVGVNNFSYRQFSNIAWTINSGDHLQYDVFCSPSTSDISSGVDFGLSDGTVLRTYGATDQNGVAAGVADLTAWARGSWYHRDITLPATLFGKTITSWAVFNEGDAAGFYRSRFANIMITGGGGPLIPGMGHVDIFISGFPEQTNVWSGAGETYSGVHLYSSDLSPFSVQDMHAAFQTSTPINGQASIIGAGPVANFSYSSSTTTITPSWTAFSIPRPDGSSVAVSASSQTAFTGLTASTTYHFGIYVDRSGLPHVVLSDNTTQKGSLTWQVQTVAADGHTVIVMDWTAATTSSGTGGGSGGGGGGVTCPADDEPMETLERGVVPAVEVVAGMHVLSGEGDSREVDEAFSVEGWLQWVLLENDGWHHVDVDHRWLRPEGDYRAAMDSDADWYIQRNLKLGDLVKDSEGALHAVLQISPAHRGRYRKIRVIPGANGDRSMRMGKTVTHNFNTI